MDWNDDLNGLVNQVDVDDFIENNNKSSAAAGTEDDNDIEDEDRPLILARLNQLELEVKLLKSLIYSRKVVVAVAEKE